LAGASYAIAAKKAGGDSELAVAAIDALRIEIAVLDAGGRVAWVSAAWRETTEGSTNDPLAGGVVGSNLLDVLRGATAVGSDHVAAEIEAVAAGARALSVGELLGSDGSPRWLLVTRQLRKPRQGAVVTRSDPTSRYPGVVPKAPDPAGVAETIARLSPRELEVLRLMTNGLDNRQIASELGVAYTTVRSHTRSLIEKLGARSRLDAVARAYRAGVRSTA
jgi:DNA-binding CsgD family transcriptional regulator